MFRFYGTWQLLFCAVFLGLAKNIGAQDDTCEGDSIEYPDYNDPNFETLLEEFQNKRDDQQLKIDCNQHQGEKEVCDKCHHNKFKTVETIEKKFGGNVKQCCGEHGYIFRDQCRVCLSFFRPVDHRVGPFFLEILVIHFVPGQRSQRDKGTP